MENKFTRALIEQPTSEDHVAALECMADGGYDQASIARFQDYIEKNNLDVGDIIHEVVRESFAYADVAGHRLSDAASILEVYAQALPDKAQAFLKKMLSFECDKPADFLTKYRFVQVVQRYAFVTLLLPDAGDQVAAEQSDLVYRMFSQAATKQAGSYLMQRYAEATLRRIKGEESPAEVDSFQWSPKIVAPRQYGFDTEASFWLTVSHGDSDSVRGRGMYVSNPKDYEKLTILLSKIANKNEKLMSQEDYELITPFFHRLTRAEIDPVTKGSDDLVGRQDLRLAEYRTLTQPFFNKEISNLVGAESLHEVDLRAQFQLFSVVKNYDEAQAERLQKFAEQYKQEGLGTFLSLAHSNPETAQHIFNIAEKLPNTSAKKVFQTYGDIVGAVDQVVEFLGNQPDATPELLYTIQTNLYHQGIRLLEEYGTEAVTCINQACEDLGRKLEERLALAKSSVFAVGAVTRQLVKEDSFDFEKFSQLELVQETPPLSDDFAEQIRTMHQSNTEQYPEKLKEYWRGTLAEALVSENTEQKFVYVKMSEDVLAVMRVIDNGSAWYGASFNVNPTIQGSRVGSELLKRVIAEMGSQKPFVADVYAENPMLQNYLDTFGFEITKTTEDYHNTGATVHEITWAEPE